MNHGSTMTQRNTALRNFVCSLFLWFNKLQVYESAVQEMHFVFLCSLMLLWFGLL